MSQATAIDSARVTRKPDVCGGKPCVAGTRIRVWDIYLMHELHARSADEIVRMLPSLKMSDVYAALAYFWDHEAEIRAEMKREDDLVASLRVNAGPSKLDPYRKQDP